MTQAEWAEEADIRMAGFLASVEQTKLYSDLLQT